MIHLGKRLAVAAATLVSMTMVVAAPGTANAATATARHHSPVVAKTDLGTMKSRVSGTVEGGRRLAGTFTPSAFEVVDGTLMATGTLDAVIRGHGKPQYASKTVSIPVQSASSPGALAAGGKGMAAAAVGSCDILNLVLGPLDLDLLGLQVHLNKVVLDIVAQSGAGNLLGNLLCSVAGLLDGGPLGGLLTGLTDLLNQILGQLGLLQL